MKRLLAAGTVVEPADRYSVVAVLGQSNAHGAGMSGVGALPVQPDRRVHQWPGCGRRRGRILQAEDPLLHEIPPGAGAGFATTFGSLLADHTGEAVLLVPSARGDTSFHQKNGYSWDPANRTARVNLYDLAVRQIGNALAAAGSGSRLAAILWHQGESDVPLTPPDVYRDRLDALIIGLRDNFGEVPFILGQMVPEEIATGHPKYPDIAAVHATTPDRHSACAHVPGPDGMHNPGGRRSTTTPPGSASSDARCSRPIGISPALPTASDRHFGLGIAWWSARFRSEVAILPGCGGCPGGLSRRRPSQPQLGRCATGSSDPA